MIEFLLKYPNFTNMPFVLSYPQLEVHIFFVKLLNWGELFKSLWGDLGLGFLGVKYMYFWCMF